MKKKRTFLLLEVLLAITIVALFAAPLMRLPIKHYQEQIKDLEAFEFRRVADYTFSEIKESLLKGSIKWNQLPAKGQTTLFPLTKMRITIPRLSTRSISRSFSMKCLGEKNGIHGEIFRIYKITITLDQINEFSYRTLIQQIVE